MDRRSVSKVAAGIVVGLIASGAAQAIGERTTATESIRGKYRHPVRIPDPSIASGCTSEAAAYAAALQAIEDAEADADAAYEAWYSCENGGSRPILTTAPLGAEYSVLVADQ